MKSIWVLVVVSAFVAGTLMTGTMASAQSSDFNVDSFFDVFYDFTLNPDRCESSFLPRVNEDLSGTDCIPDTERNFPPDSFFDVFFDVEVRSADNEETLRTVQTEILSLQLVSDQIAGIFGDPDFGALFGDPDFLIGSLQETDRTIQTEIVALQALHEESTASTDYFLKIEGVPGESTDDEHKEWINIESFSHSMSPSSGAERSRAGVTLGDVVVVKELDKSTPKIGEAITKGEHFDKATIDLVRTLSDGTRVTYYQYELKNVLITSYSIGGSGEGGSTPTENFSLNFEEVKVTYTEGDGTKGKVEATWKVGKGEK